jgi:hypothetical protein
VQFTDKDPTEAVRLGIDFSKLLATGETISTATVGIRTAGGVSTNAMLSGGAAISSPIVRQMIVGGVPGTAYKLSFVATTSTGQTFIEGANLLVTERD